MLPFLWTTSKSESKLTIFTVTTPDSSLSTNLPNDIIDFVVPKFVFCISSNAPESIILGLWTSAGTPANPCVS